MASVFHCDICQKSTYIHPLTEPQWEEHTVSVEVPYSEEVQDPESPSKTNKVLRYKTETKTTRIPKMTTMKRQNHQTGIVEEIPIQDIKDLQPRTYIIRLMVGSEVVQKDLCKECLSVVMPEIQTLWDKLATLKDND
jgi:hypothetical protein